MSSLNGIRPGDEVTILVYAGLGRNGPEYVPKSGKAVICGPDRIALNMGGKYGKPGVAMANNIVAINRRRVAA